MSQGSSSGIDQATPERDRISQMLQVLGQAQRAKIQGVHRQPLSELQVRAILTIGPRKDNLSQMVQAGRVHQPSAQTR